MIRILLSLSVLGIMLSCEKEIVKEEVIKEVLYPSRHRITGQTE